ncbi:dehydrogenase E1 component subunit alpha/beta [Terricaulis sp.]|uniref:dehydrogenase E1 component subunit alpha/beta n=1 Tax=Terricaulis sp. TaxID=2768686 RepID=UPI003784A7B8
MDPAESVHRKFVSRLKSGEFPASASNISLGEAGLSGAQLADIFHTQALCRQMDRLSRKLQARGESHYTIGSSGHESLAVIAEALRVDDMAFLHYRDAAFQMQRGKRVAGETPIWDFLLSFSASAEDPISGGRHKVLGSKRLAIPPQTSTIASHLPKAVGAAHAIGLARALEHSERALADDSIVFCSFGDASANHSTAQGAINTACWTAYQDKPMPLLFLCEDNGIGISTKTPPGWIGASFAHRAALRYFECNGFDPLMVFATTAEAARYVRETRRPAFLHMTCVRLYGHAGSDVQAAYLSKLEIEANEASDPLLQSAAALIRAGVMTGEDILALYDDLERTAARVGEFAIRRPKLATREEVVASLIPARRSPPPPALLSKEERDRCFGSDVVLMDKPQPMARLVSWALTDLMLAHREIVVAGEDVGRKGGVYGATLKLQQRFGAERVIDTLLDEQSILGLGLGLAHNSLLAIPEIQFLAYVHNAEDQLRGEASTLSFFSSGQFTNPMVVRIPGLGYQKGFGGHFHNENSLAVFRDIPGLILACPSNGRDAVAMLRECVRLAREEQRVVVFLEPIALYMTRDLHQEGDGLASFLYEAPDNTSPIALGELGQFGDGGDLAIVSYGNGVHLSLQAQKLLTERHGLDAKVIDLRWLAPLASDALLEATASYENVLIVDECRITGSQSEALMTLFTERAPHIRTRRIAAQDCFIPLGRAATLPLPSRDEIVATALQMTRRSEAAA